MMTLLSADTQFRTRSFISAARTLHQHERPGAVIGLVGSDENEALLLGVMGSLFRLLSRMKHYGVEPKRRDGTYSNAELSHS